MHLTDDLRYSEMDAELIPSRFTFLENRKLQ